MARTTDRAARAQQATELDGPGAIISHAEVLDAWEDSPGATVGEVAYSLGVSNGTVRRLLGNLRRAGLTE